MKPLRICLVSALCAPFVSAQITGVVLDARSGQSLQGAVVTLQGTTIRATTAIDGSFTLAASGANISIVAAKKGYFYASQRVTAPASAVLIAMDQVKLGNDPAYQFIDPPTCGQCHPEQLTQWNNSPMARAGTNSWVYDIYDGTGTTHGSGGFVYTRDSAFAANNPESECAACHQPEPWVAAGHTALEPIGALSQGALHGVSCEICHKIADIDETKTNFPGIYPGVVTLNRPRASQGQVEYGVLRDVSFELPGLMRGSYQPQLVAAACAACHQDKNDPDEDGDFEEANGVISEPTYLEWLASPYGDPASSQYADCVDCHMPAYGSQYACYMRPVQRDPNTIRSHEIRGTSPEYLENAVDLGMTVVENGPTLDVTVDVTNSLTGHHVPTGVTVRNMILLVEAWSLADGQRLTHTSSQTVHDLGGVGSPANGYFAGLPGKLYGKHNHDAQGRGPTFFTDATGIQWDNRIPALATDTTRYMFAVPAGTGTLRVRARLVYRRAWRALVDAKQWATDGHGDPLEDVLPPYFGHLMEESEWTSAGPTEVSTFGTACGGIAVGVDGSPWAGNPDFGLTIRGVNPGGRAALLLGWSNSAWNALGLPLDLAPLGAPGCWLLVSPDAVVERVADATGAARVSLAIPVTSPVGTTFHAQWLVRDPTSALGLAASDAVRVTLQR